MLDTQQGAVQQFVRNTGEVFGALSERQGQLAGLIRNSGIVFHTTAVRNQDLEATFRALPTFLDESRLTLNRLRQLLQQRQSADHPAPSVGPGAEQGPEADRQGHPGLQRLLRRAAEDREAGGLTGLPALQKLLNNDLPPLLHELIPFTQQLTPIIEGIGRYQSDITGLLGNVTGATEAQTSTEAGVLSHYIRSSAPLYPEDLGMFGPTPASEHRLAYSRLNPYVAPNSALNVINGLRHLRHEGRAPTRPGLTVGLGPDAGYTGNPFFSNRATFDTAAAAPR